MQLASLLVKFAVSRIWLSLCARGCRLRYVVKGMGHCAGFVPLSLRIDRRGERLHRRVKVKPARPRLRFSRRYALT